MLSIKSPLKTGLISKYYCMDKRYPQYIVNHTHTLKVSVPQTQETAAPWSIVTGKLYDPQGTVP